ncbi:ankyrin repeat-containing domain protein [Morchella snyderi]|nr:ankyrin repeat-containing domain protein [Morchella snyderi]
MLCSAARAYRQEHHSAGTNYTLCDVLKLHFGSIVEIYLRLYSHGHAGPLGNDALEYHTTQANIIKSPIHPAMGLLELPPELIMLIAERLDTLGDKNRLVRTSRGIYRIVNKVLYDAMDKNAVLRWAARNGRGDLISLVLDMGAKIDSHDKEDRTALHWAATYAHDAHLITLLECSQEIHAVVKSPLHTVEPSEAHAAPLRILLDRGADIASQSWFRDRLTSHTPLHWAAGCGNVAAVELLLERGAEIDQEGGMVRYTPLILAAINDHERVVRLLLAKGADVKAITMWNETALHWAAWAGHEAVAVALLEHGAPLEDLGSDLQTPLIEAARENHEGLARILLEHGANIDTRNVDHDTPLNIAAERGFLGMISLLLAHGADLTIKNHSRSPLHSAAYAGRVAVVDFLLREGGADIKERLEHNGYNMLHTAVAGRGDLALIHLLLDRGLHPADLTADGHTAVHLAHMRNRYDLAAAMLNHTPFSPLQYLTAPAQLRDPAALDALVRATVELLAAHALPATHYLTTALYSACAAGLVHSARILIAAGADVNDRRSADGATPLLAAVASGNEPTVRLLLSAHAECDALGQQQGPGEGEGPGRGRGDEDGETPLRRAAVAGNVAIARALLECGADLHMRDWRGRTLLHRVVMEGEEGRGGEMVRFLMSWGANPDQSDCQGVTAWDVAGDGWARRALMEAGVDDPYRHWKEAMEEVGQ